MPCLKGFDEILKLVSVSSCPISSFRPEGSPGHEVLVDHSKHQFRSTI